MIQTVQTASRMSCSPNESNFYIHCLTICCHDSLLCNNEFILNRNILFDEEVKIFFRS